MTLELFFAKNPRAALAFSGGVDSAYLLWAGKHYGCEMTAYYVHSAFQPAFELRDAQRLAGEVGVPLRIIEGDILSVPMAVANGPGRCYHCKRAIFSLLWQAARRDGHTLLLDGTNASDDADDRPGMRALQELQVRSPLRECALTKGEIRAQSRQAGLFTWDKLAYACLATRVPTGQTIRLEDLQHVEAGENALFQLGFTDFRIRLLGNGANIQLPSAQMERASAQREEILSCLKPYFPTILLDLQGREGSE